MSPSVAPRGKTPMKMKTSSMVALFATAALLLSACGRKDSNAVVQTEADKATKQPAAPPAADAQQIEITGNDAMKFSLTEIRVKPGAAVAVTLRNIGTMPKFSMGHNWVLLKKGVAPEKFVELAANAATTDYVPREREADILAHTKLLGPKESDTVTFYAPNEPGRYVFLCSFPGHYQVGMRGELIVE